jgi:predicted phage terminase large subunit-like protein
MPAFARRSTPTPSAEDFAFSRLAAFSAMLHPEMPPAAHHRLLCRKLEAVERGECKRLMVFLPPGSAKSHYANVMFSAWFMGRNPKASILVCSASSSLAEQWGRRVRNIVAQPLYQRIFRTTLSSDNAAADRWATSHGGQYYAAGVGANIVGRRSDLACLDDPVADREHADSANEREKLWQWYKWDFWTRLKPEAAVILIQTRWSEDDLAGRLLADAKSGGEQWDVVSIPALAEDDDPLGRAPGQPLWPEWFTSAMFAEAQRNARSWSALYQQRPMPESGDYFRREYLRYYETPPARSTLHVYGASDYAVTADGGDWTVHVVAGVDPDDNLYVLDMWRQRTASDRWVEALLDLADRWRPMDWAEEQGQILKSIGPFLERRANERRTYFSRQQFVSVRDKATRAQSIRARMAMGKVYFPRNAPWTTDLVSELLSFPAGKHDDQCDALALLGRLLDDMVAGSRPTAPKKPTDRWARTFGNTDDHDSWKVA